MKKNPVKLLTAKAAAHNRQAACSALGLYRKPGDETLRTEIERHLLRAETYKLAAKLIS